MKAFEIIQLLTKGLIPLENCGTHHFDSSNLSELSILFGRNYSWAGHMFMGDLIYIYHAKTADWYCDNYTLLGQSLTDEDLEIYVFKIGD